MSRTNFDDVKNSIIDKEGLTFKYILVNLSLKSSPDVVKTIVRGYEDCYYHGDILDEVMCGREKLGVKDINYHCTGGGRIKHGHKKILIYGYSQGFGKGNHELAKSILLKDLPDYEITCSDEGY